MDFLNPAVLPFQAGTRVGPITSLMRYKSFEFPHNPRTSSYTVNKNYAAHKYPEINGVEIEDLGVGEITIKCEGEFFGANAFQQWTLLNDVCLQHGIGDIFHPLHPEVTRGIMTDLTANLEPREMYVAYSFTLLANNFTLAKKDVPILNIVSASDSNSNTNGSTDGTNNGTQPQTTRFKVGDIVIANGYYYYSAAGKEPRKQFKNKEITITRIESKYKYPYMVGRSGWMQGSDLKLRISSSKDTSKTNLVYTVKIGDNIHSIANMLNVDWKNLALENKIKNPDSIQPGDTLKIPGVI